jgi:hypothetical protein
MRSRKKGICFFLLCCFFYTSYSWPAAGEFFFYTSYSLPAAHFLIFSSSKVHFCNFFSAFFNIFLIKNAFFQLSMIFGSGFPKCTFWHFLAHFLIFSSPQVYFLSLSRIWGSGFPKCTFCNFLVPFLIFCSPKVHFCYFLGFCCQDFQSALFHFWHFWTKSKSSRQEVKYYEFEAGKKATPPRIQF